LVADIAVTIIGATLVLRPHQNFTLWSGGIWRCPCSI